MRVCVVSASIPPAYSGAGLAAYRYATRLFDKGRLALVLTETNLFNYGSIEGQFGVRERLFDNKIVRTNSRPSVLSETRGRIRRSIPFLLNRISAGIFMGRILSRYRESYDVVHCFSPTWHSLVAVLVGRLLGKRVVLELTLLGGDDPTSKETGLRSILFLRKWIQYRLANVIVCLSPALMRACRDAGIPQEKLAIVPRAVDAAVFRPADSNEQKQLRSLLGFSESDKIILFVGGLTKRKGVDILLPALFQLINNKLNYKAVLVASTTKTMEERIWHDKLLSMRKAASVHDAIQTLAPIANVHEYMKVADVFVLPSRSEGFPNVLVEAMSCGTPVITARISGITDEIIEHQVNGIVVNELSDIMLASAIENVLSDALLAERLGREARNTVLRRYTTQYVDGLYENLYFSN